MTKQIIEDLDQQKATSWGRETVKLSQKLPDWDLFGDDGLADLIDNLPEHCIAINTMTPDGHHLDSWSYCDRNGISGKEILELVKSGQLWINLTQLDVEDQRFADLLDRIYGEFEESIPGFKTFKRSMGLLISSPNAQVFYHSDVPGQTLWQIRGNKRIYLYPDEYPFMNPAEIEQIVRGITEEEMTYHAWYDDHAEVIDLQPGDMLHWQLNRPHRVVNLESVNVSITTSHWTPEIRRSYAMNYGNGILRDFGMNPRSRALNGPAFWAKAGLALAWRLMRLHGRNHFQRQYRYKIVNRNAPSLVPISET